MGNKLVKHTLYIGLNDKDTHAQVIQTVEAYKVVYNLLQAVGYQGATISESTGLYIHEDGSVVTEKSLRVEILFGDTGRTDQLIAQLKAALNQESIALQVEHVTSYLK